MLVLDKEDELLLQEYNWYLNGRYWAGTRWCKKTKQREKVLLHRLIMGALPGQQVDHINRDREDNRRCNLRLATPSQNLANQTKKPGATSLYKGVCQPSKRRRWKAGIRGPHGRIHLGSYASEQEAAYVYDKYAEFIHGEFALTNGITLGTLIEEKENV